MSYYDNQQWPVATSQNGGWEKQTPPARSGANSAVPREDPSAFGSQLEEVDRALENLFKSGKIFSMQPRRDSMPMGGSARAFPEQYGMTTGVAGVPSRHHSVSDFGDARTFSASNLQNFYATQRHQPARASEVEQAMQAKRRMAAQRERELRNYHQEQQFNRSVLAEISSFGSKPDRTMSPGSGMSEEERRDVIARQRSALYGESQFPESGAFTEESGVARPATQGSNQPGTRHSPLAFDHFPGQNSLENATVEQNQSQVTQPQGQRSRANSTSSPSSNAANFSLFENAQQSSRTSTSSPGGSPPRQGKVTTGSNVAPIGTRPAQAANSALTKPRSTTPLPSPLSYGFAVNEDNGNTGNGDRATSAASNPSSAAADVSLGWSTKTGVWGKNSLGVQASVWG